MRTDAVQRRLENLGKLAQAGKRVNGLHRLMRSRILFEYAVSRTRTNRGSATPGIDQETLDGLTIERVNGWVRSLNQGTHHAQPVLRAYIPKANGKLRPLGIPTYLDRMVQDVQRQILEQIYEPVFSTYSYGFRPGRSCHTALTQIQRFWTAAKWFVEVDIRGYFDNINHELLLDLLRKRIDDEDFIATIKAQLQAGVMEPLTGKHQPRKGQRRERRYERRNSYSGTPQGGIVSPILANIYLHEMDTFMEKETENFNKGKSRAVNPAYKQASDQLTRLRKKVGQLGADEKDVVERERLLTEVRRVTVARRSLPSRDSMDPNYRRLMYVRYADDFLIGVIGSKSDALAVLERIKVFLKEVLQLEVSPDKTGVVKATDGASFLGYDILTKTGVRIAKIQKDGFIATKRCSGERVILSIPRHKLLEFCNKHGYGDYLTCEPRHRAGLLRSSDYEIVSIYNAELRGFANYYRLDNRIKSRLNQLTWVAQGSLWKTLAGKHKTRTSRIRERMRQSGGGYAVRHKGRGGATLTTQVWRPLDITSVGVPSRSIDVDQQPLGVNLAWTSTDVTDRLLSGTCENTLCKSPAGTPIHVHHVRALADVRRSPFIDWLRSARSRRTRYLCVKCHQQLHATGKGVQYANGEPDAVKVASPVLRGGALQSCGQI